MKVRLYVDIEEEVRRQIKAVAALKGESLNNYVESILKEAAEADMVVMAYQEKNRENNTKK